MSSRGQRAAGTDGTDFQHRQRIAAHYQESAQYKFILKWFFAPHILILIFMWAKKCGLLLAFPEEAVFRLEAKSYGESLVGEALSSNGLICHRLIRGNMSGVYRSSLSSVRCCRSLRTGLVKLINYHYYGHFVFGILPCMIGLGGQLPELFDYMSDQENSQTPTFKVRALLWCMLVLN
ncbi:hypothetical protein ANCCEY_13828 [Ancylostoma ceylanicum]|uniref:Uncharacterized protein n=1 Tax=Ancylostoma ceylanicum TaxID=53326 RepID=A0A0D6LHF6_9BILA|nr:hypothetical protein ANCCEY_13828 [Ancylostoma ceylanicum]